MAKEVEQEDKATAFPSRVDSQVLHHQSQCLQTILSGNLYRLYQYIHKKKKPSNFSLLGLISCWYMFYKLQCYNPAAELASPHLLFCNSFMYACILKFG